MHQQIREGRIPLKRGQEFNIYKYMIITEKLRGGEFLDVLLGMRPVA